MHTARAPRWVGWLGGAERRAGTKAMRRTRNGGKARAAGGEDAATRRAVLSAGGGLAGMGMMAGMARAEEGAFVAMPALAGKGYGKTPMRYPDFELDEQTGLQYKDYRIGLGAAPKPGDVVVVDWAGYTIGYYGRIIEARNLAKGGDFEGGDDAFLRFTIGQGAMVREFDWNRFVLAGASAHADVRTTPTRRKVEGFESAILNGMREGGIRRVVVPPGPLSYDNTNNPWEKRGPTPRTFSGKRTLDFVASDKGAIDKTIMFDIELLGVGSSARSRRAKGTWVDPEAAARARE